MTTKRRTAVLVSGRGSNMVALAEAAAAADYPAEIVLVISNRPDAAGLATAAARGIPTMAIDHRPFGSDRGAHEVAVDAALRAHGVEIVCLAGYLRLLSPYLVSRWSGRMLNIHPSLLPAYKGLHTHERVLAAGETRHGCSVHLVTEDLDSGPILAQAEVPVLPGDTPDILSARVLEAEHTLYPRALAAMAMDLPPVTEHR
ncbi:phosphoribosylglycinamide formyltransferase [Acidisoma sp.]|uniref:phosphoribosylglycinamide formyltransferase n=1 Tax=Acidisoma sp. TaxID=1872115 RepID=UPI003AFFE4B6